MTSTHRMSRFGSLAPGLHHCGELHVNLPPASLCEHAVRRQEGRLSREGAFTAVTHPHTGRSPHDRFIVRSPSIEEVVAWGDHNRGLAPDHASALRRDLVEYLGGRELFVHEAFAADDERHRIGIRVITENAWHAMFSYNMFLRASKSDLANFSPDFTVFHAPTFEADPAKHGTHTGTAVVLDLERREVLIAGTRYAGEIKKSIFSALNFLLPADGVLPMHCAANLDENEGDVALFFGLSGTGKTTLSAENGRRLIGDDEHGWGADGIFNFEGGCYAKVIDLSQEAEPAIFAATRRFGTILENVGLGADRRVRFSDRSLTENTRASYPIDYIPGAVVGPSQAPHPLNVIFLTADAFGVLPPISRLTPEQAMYHFLSGYTAKVAGTERGITEPVATFSACFGAPFMPRPASVYATMLGELLNRHRAKAWLVNTGWTGGGYGVGSRISLPYTRSMVFSILSGQLEWGGYHRDDTFGVMVPNAVRGVPRELLTPRKTWNDPSAFDDAATRLANMFHGNFEGFRATAGSKIAAAGPRR